MLALLLTLLASVAAAHQAGRILSPTRGETLHAGEIVEIRWSSVEKDVDELEILLSLGDDGAPPLRLTAQLEPGTAAFRWTVPNLPARSARIWLRVGLEGEEVEGTPSEPFTITGTTSSAPAAIRLSAGELWVSGFSFFPTELPTRQASLAQPATASEAEPAAFLPRGPQPAEEPELAPPPAGRRFQHAELTLVSRAMMRRPVAAPLRE